MTKPRLFQLGATMRAVSCSIAGFLLGADVGEHCGQRVLSALALSMILLMFGADEAMARARGEQ